MNSHDKWAVWPTAENQKYLDKYGSVNALGKRSSSRRKKLKKLKTILIQRERVERLLTSQF